MVLVEQFFCINLRTTTHIVAWLDASALCIDLLLTGTKVLQVFPIALDDTQSSAAKATAAIGIRNNNILLYSINQSDINVITT